MGGVGWATGRARARRRGTIVEQSWNIGVEQSLAMPPCPTSDRPLKRCAVNQPRLWPQMGRIWAAKKVRIFL